MKPQDRIRRYTQLATAATIVVCVMLCFFLIVSPKASRLRGVEGDLAQSSKKLAEMRKEIENASILGTPAPGESRYEKFRILGADEEQLFLSDLIEFCKETNNTLNMVRPADIPRPATPSPPQDQNNERLETTGRRLRRGLGCPPAHHPEGPPYRTLLRHLPVLVLPASQARGIQAPSNCGARRDRHRHQPGLSARERIYHH